MEGPMEMPVRQPQRGLMFARRAPVSARVSARVTTTAPEVITASLQGVAAVRGSANHAPKPVSPCGIPSVDAMEELMEMRVRQLWPVYRSWQPGPALPSVHLSRHLAPDLLGGLSQDPRAFKTPSRLSCASPKSICVFSLKNNGFSTPAYPVAMERFRTIV